MCICLGDNKASAQPTFWSPTGLTNRTTMSLCVNPPGSVFAGTEGSGIFKSTNRGALWTQVLPVGGSSQVWSIAFRADGMGFAAVNGFGVYRTTTNGDSWSLLWPYPVVMSTGLDHEGDVFVGTSGAGAYRTTDNGLNWVSMNLPPRTVQSFAVSPNDHIFAGGSMTDGTLGVYRSTNRGEEWQSASIGLPTQGGVFSLTINSQGYIFAATNTNGVNRSTDDGNSWHGIGAPLVMSAPFALITAPGDVIYAACFVTGVYRSTDSGQSWTQISSGLPLWGALYYYPRSIAIDSAGFLFAGTQDSGVYRSSFTTRVADEYNRTDRGTPKLISAYPNPFNLSTTINFQLSQRGNVQLNIYNSLGQFVRSLLNEQREAGTHSLTWDGRDDQGSPVSSGAYFYQVRIGDLLQAKKMLLLK
jgi:photosystem II stability/assembly factor-like uncharacterized protein